MEEAGRPLSAVGIEGRFTYGIGGPTEWLKMAAVAAKQWTATFNPRPVTEDDLLQIYRKAL